MIRFWLVLLLVIVPLPARTQAVDPILEMTLEDEAAIPGQPVVLRLTVLVPTWMPKPPVFPSFEIPNVAVRLPERASGPTSRRIGGATWSGITRAYRLYPMTVGRFRIPSQTLRVTYADPGTRQPVEASLTSDPIRFSGVAPEGAEDLDPFIAANALTLEQVLEGDPADLEPGDAVTWTLTATIDGTSPIFLPPLIVPVESPAIAAYPKEPVVAERDNRGVLSGTRTEAITYLAEAGGRAAIPTVRLDWYNLKTKAIETAEIDGFEIVSRGPPPRAERTVDQRELVMSIVAAAVIIAVITALSRWVRPRVTAWFKARQAAYRASSDFAYTAARSALFAEDVHQSLKWIAIWTDRLPPVSAGAPVEKHLAAALLALGRARYGPGTDRTTDRLWSDARFALEQARTARRAAASAKHATGLPPLNPREA